MEPTVQRNHDRAALSGRWRATTDRAGAYPQFAHASRRQQAPRCGRGPGQGLQGQHPPVYADHQYACQGQGDLRPLARLQGCGRQPASRQPCRARSGGSPGRRRASGLSAHRAPLLCHEGQMARQGQARLLGPQRAAPRQAGTSHCLVRRGADRARCVPRLCARDGSDRQALLRGTLDRRAGARGQITRRVLASDRAVGAPLHSA